MTIFIIFIYAHVRHFPIGHIAQVNSKIPVVVSVRVRKIGPEFNLLRNDIIKIDPRIDPVQGSPYRCTLLVKITQGSKISCFFSAAGH